MVILALQACNQGPTTEAAATEVDQESIDGPQLSLSWESPAYFPTNESVLYDPQRDIYYVSCIAGDPTLKDETGHIARIDSRGGIIDSVWAYGLHAPKGMCIFEGRLYVTNIDEIVSMNLDNPEDRLSYPVPGAEFLNDLCPGPRGVFFSDMKTGKLHYFEGGIVHTINEELPNLNGLAFFEDELYALAESGLLRLSLGGEVLETVNSKLSGGDGLIPLGGNRFIASRWKGEIWYVEGSDAKLLLDSKDAGLQTADIGFDPGRQLVLVPRFFADKVSAYQLQGI